MLNNSQFVKLFDRRFVANTLRNSCRCPKCRIEYSFSYDMADKFGKDQHIKSNRPILLPCGHNMCENCVYNNRHNLTCTTCLKPVEISHDDPTQQTRFYIRDNFDMNFYLMGELNSLRQFRKDYSSNNAMTMTGMDAASGTASSVVKCIECELVPSMGKCRQCKVYLCKRCFDAVHKNSKVLKMHTMQRFDKDKNKSNVMRLMKPHYCKRHQNIINRYCTKCDLFCCYDCAKNDHAQHKWTTLLEENNKLMPYIAETLDNIQTSRENVKKGQKEIKSVETQLEEYASKTMEDISNYFLQLHSFLQNEERQITEKFSEMCQQPQLKLREANTKLNESQDMLNAMRSNLEYYQHKPPIDFHFGKILKLYSEQLQEVPSNIQITKPHSNPFNFEIKQDIRQDIRNYYDFSYNDPRIFLKMNISSFGSSPSLADTTVSMMSSLSITPDTLLKTNTQQRKPQQKANIKSKNNKKKQKNFSQNPLPPNDSNNSVSTDAISLSKNFQVSSTSHKAHQSAREENSVRITYIQSPENFYIQNVNDIHKIRELSHTYLNCNLGNRIPNEMTEGYYCMAYHTNDKQWYRGMLKKIVNDEVYKIFLVDFGLHLEVSKEKLCDIDPKHLKIPFAAIRCAIYDIMPAEKQWTEVANNLFVELLQNKPAHMSIIEKINNEMLKIDLQTYNTKSVRDSFLYTGLARERPGVFSFKMQIKATFPATKIEDRIPKNIINITDIILVNILCVEGPQEFYVIKNELIDSKKQFVKDLNQFYASSQSDKLQQIYLATTQMCCVICIKEIWHRAVIEEVNFKGQLAVRLVDEGRRELINWRQAFVLDEKFRKTTEFSLRCALADIEPLQENGYIYTQTAIQDFKQMCTNPSLKMELQAIKQNEYKVILYVSKKNMDINIGAALVKNKHGISTGESTQTREFAKTPKKRLGLPQKFSNENITTPLQYHQHSATPSQDIVESIPCLTKNDNMKLLKSKEILNPTQSSSSSKQQAVQPLKRTLIQIMHFINPGEFYIQLCNLSRGTKTFHQNIQDSQSKKYGSDQQPPPQEKREWFMQNHCLVYTKYHSSTVVINQKDIPFEQCEWYRGVITNISYLPGEEPKFSVFLRDIGATICSIASQQLFSIDPQLDRVTNAVYRCHLACIEPAAGGKIWSSSSIDDFRNMTSKFETLSVSLQGKRCSERNSLPVVLWGSKTETADPLAPCITKYSNVNRALVRHGLAYIVGRLDVTQQFDEIEEMECDEGEITLEQWFKAFSDNALLKVIERNEQELPSILRKSGDFGADDNNDNAINYTATEENPLNIHLSEFDFKYSTNQNAPAAWLTSKIITKTIFTGIPTYIDFDCMVYLHEADDKEFLDKLSKEINKSYGNLPPPSADYVYKIGQPCLSKFHLDQKFYRGIVVKNVNEKNEWSVRFVDYGNIEVVESKDMRPYAPYPNLPSIANKYIIDGIKPKGGAKIYDVKDLDQMHILLVTKFVSVRIPTSELNNPIKRCNLRIANVDIASDFIERGLAEADYILPSILRAESKSSVTGNSFKMRRNLNPLPSDPLMEDYDIFNQDINMSVKDMHNLVIDDEDEDNDNVADDTLSIDSDNATKFDYLNEMIQRLDKNTNMEQPLIKTTTTAATISTTTTTGINNQPPPPKKRMFNDIDYTQMMSGVVFDSDRMKENFEDDDVFDAEDLGDKAFCIDYEQYDDDDDVVELEEKYELNYWHGVGEDMLEEEEKEISQQLEKRASYQEEQDIESEFDGFHPNETSTVFSHFSGIEFFKFPQLPAAMHYFNCRVNSMLTSTILHIFPLHTEFRYREVELQRLIKQLVKPAPMLAQFEPRTICLARYTKDKIWYRALIRSYNPNAKTVDVLYVDYLNSETLPVKYIRQCPSELLGWPLRTFRVRLHGIKPNPNIKDHDIRVALYKLLAKRTLFAVVKKHPNNRGATQGLDPVSSSLSDNDLMEIALYESQEVSLKGITIYEPLIESNYFQRI